MTLWLGLRPRGCFTLFGPRQGLLLWLGLVLVWLGLRPRGCFRRSLLACRLRHWGLRVLGFGFLLEYRLRLLGILLALPHRFLTRGGRAVPKRLLLLPRKGRWGLLLAR